MATKTNRPDALPDVQQTDGQQTSTPSPRLLSIEKHREQLKIKIPVFIGVCAVNGWKPGRVMTEAEFRRAAEAFTGAPINGKTVK
jgi:hypothetical protein